MKELSMLLLTAMLSQLGLVAIACASNPSQMPIPISPIFRSYPATDKQGSIASFEWEVAGDRIRVIEECDVDQRVPIGGATTYNVPVKSRGLKSVNIECSHEIFLPFLTRDDQFSLLGFSDKVFPLLVPNYRLSSGTTYLEAREAIRQLRAALISGSAIDFSLNDAHYKLSIPSDYQTHLTSVVASVEQHQNAMAAKAARRREEARQRARAERDERLISYSLLAVGTIAGLLVLGKIVRASIWGRLYRSGAQTSRKLVKAAAFKSRRPANAGQELAFWSELRDKGDISQEEFEKKKNELL